MSVKVSLVCSGEYGWDWIPSLRRVYDDSKNKPYYLYTFVKHLVETCGGKISIEGSISHAVFENEDDAALFILKYL